MPDIKVEIQGDDIEQAVVAAIIESAIGKNIQAAIDRALKDFNSSYSRAITDVLDTKIKAIIAEQVHIQLGEIIRARTGELLVADGKLDELLSIFVSKLSISRY